MLKIAICDDNPIDAAFIRECLLKISFSMDKEFEMQYFNGGEQLSNKLKHYHFDIILLDIIMGGIDGIETARNIRSMGNDSKIIFISNYDEKIRDLIRVGIVDFIDKPVSQELLSAAILRAIKLIIKDAESIFIYEKKGVKSFIPTKDIIYFKSDRNQITIFTTKYELTYSNTMKNIWGQLKDNINFIMPSQSRIYNLKHAYVEKNAIILIMNHSKTNIGRKFKADTESRYLDYIERKRLR